MVKTVQELKELMLWAKEQKISSIKIGEIAFEVHPYAFIQEIEKAPSTPEQAPTEGLSETDTKQLLEDEELLYHSSR